MRSMTNFAVSIFLVVVLTASCKKPAPKHMPLSAGEYFTCAVTKTGGVKCWGLNSNGQLGDAGQCGETCARPTPVKGLSSGVVSVAAGMRHACALTAENNVMCWGSNEKGQLGDGTRDDRDKPVHVIGLPKDIVEIDAGALQTCALSSSGKVYCWGQMMTGADQERERRAKGVAVPEAVAGINNAVAISCGAMHNCIVDAGGGLKCWGVNTYGQLGNGTSDNSETPVSTMGLETGVYIVGVGYTASFAALKDGGMMSWGLNKYGQLGDDTKILRRAPVKVETIDELVTQIDANLKHACALTVTGAVYCWGNNDFGQLGSGDRWDIHKPYAIQELQSGVKAITTGKMHSCAMIEDGSVKCWGANSFGQLGDSRKCGEYLCLKITDVDL